MFGKLHIHQHGAALCHESGGAYMQFNEAAGANPDNCCTDCWRRYTNLAKMSGIAPHRCDKIEKQRIRQELNLER